MVTSVWRPRVKPEHAARRMPDGRIRIGGAVYGIAAEVTDRTGAVWTMLTAADGTRTCEEIVDAVRSAHPGERSSAVHAALRRFVDAGYLENAAASDPPGLTAREKERYDRSRRYFRWVDLNRREHGWEPQLRLGGSRAVVVGLGGGGGTAALALVASGVGRVHCVDYDVVELSNLNRQVLYVEADVGRPKVQAAVQRLREVNSDVAVTGELRRIAEEADLRPLVEDCDVLLLCADQPAEIRMWANRACLATGTPWVETGYHGPVASATAYVPGRGPCYECVWLTEQERRYRADPEGRFGVQPNGHHAAIAPSAGLSGHLAAHLSMAVLTGVPPIEPGQTQGVNLMAADHHFLITDARRPDCPACGGLA
jgi:molybdopterin/thiamine biosynthesis adenylyltransferase